MKTRRHVYPLPLLALFALGACDDHGTMPVTEEPGLALEDQVALEVLGDDQAIEASLSLAEVGAAAGARHGFAHGGSQAATQLATEARIRFRAAQDALGRGDRVRAANESREARRLVAQAMTSMGGPRAAWSQVERLDYLITSVSEDPTAYSDAATLLGELGAFATRARVKLQDGNGLGAGALGVLAQQRHQQKRREQDPAARRHRADLTVSLAGTAVSLATRILESQGADDEQLRYLEAAREYLAKAETALEAGNDRRAVYLAEHAHWASLKALVLPGGVTAEEARAMADLAEDLYGLALEAVGDEPTELEAALLQRARRLIEAGLAKLEEGQHRGVGALWRAAVICTWLIG
jgi:hypothetical protein